MRELFFLFSLLGLLARLPGQAPILRFDRLNIEDGLSHSLVTSIAQDDLGFMWIGTQDGLNRFDGHTFKQYYPIPNKANSLQHHWVTIVKKDQAGRLWLVYGNGGLCLFEPEQESFTTFWHQPGDVHSLSSHYFSNVRGKNHWIHEDENGQIWVGTKKGLHQYRSDTRDFQRHLFSGAEGVPAQPAISHILPGPSGSLWLSTTEGLVQYWPAEGRARLRLPIDYQSGDNILSLLPTHEGDIWVGSLHKGLYRVSANPRNAPQQYLDELGVSETIDGEIAVQQLVTDQKGRLWAATSNGLFVIHSDGNIFRIPELGQREIPILYQDQHDNIWATSGRTHLLWRIHTHDLKVETYQHDPHLGNSLGPNQVKVFFEDNKGVLWMGHEKGGLTLVNLYEMPFVHLGQGYPGMGQIPTSDAYGLYIDPQGRLWMGTHGGLYIKDFQTGEETTWPLSKRQPGQIYTDDPYPTGRLVGTMQPDRKGGLWLGYFDYKVSYYNPETGQFRNYHHAPDHPGAFKMWSLRDICVGQDGTVYFGGTNFGLCILEPGVDTFRYALPDPDNPEALADGWIYDLEEDREGNIWVGTRNAGLHRYNPRTGQFKRYLNAGGPPSSEHTIRAIFLQEQDEEDILWLATGKGLCRFNPKTETCTLIDASYGLPNSVIHGIVADDHQRLWISSNIGLTCYDPRTGNVSHYAQSDGLQSNEFNERAYLKGPDGRLYFGGVKGVSVFHPDSLTPNPFRPDLALTELRINNQVVYPGAEINGRIPLSRSISYIDHLTLKPADKVVSFSIAAFHFAAPEKIRIRYRLSPFETQWTVLGPQQRDISYTNLPAGTFTLQLECTDLNGTWGGDTHALKIEVLPPFWVTTWFKVLLLILLLLTTFAYVQVRTRKLTQKKRVLARLVQARTQALEDKSEQLERIYHELQARQAEVLAQNKQIAEQRDRLALHNEELAAQKAEVEWMAERMHESDQSKLNFFTNVSHEFRTPLTLILGQTERLLDQETFADTDSVRQQLELMYRNEMRLFRLINQLLEIRAVESGRLDLKLEQRDAVTFCRELCQLFEPLAQRQGIDLQFETSAKEIPFVLDTDKLEKILYNLLSNAFKYVSEQGRITLRLELDGQTLHLRVSNTGPAISAEVAPHIFDRFFYANQAVNGALSSGIGLSLVRDLTHQLGGSVVLCPNSQETCFLVSLPSPNLPASPEPAPFAYRFTRSMMPREQEENQDYTPPVRPMEDSEQPIILIVDDQPDMRQYLHTGMGGRYRVLLAEDGQSGIDMARRYVPDIIISDVMMPGVDGLALTETLKQDPRTSHIPILLLTAKVQEADLLAGLQAGADAYLTKPFHLAALHLKLHNMLATRESLISSLQESIPEVPAHIQVKEIDQNLLNRIIKIIEDHLDDPELNGDLIAREVGLSKGSLYRKLKALSGLTVNLFIRQVRLRIAAQLLKKGNYCVSDVAYAVGFDNPKYFSVCFKESFGSSPRDYMQQHEAVKT